MMSTDRNIKLMQLTPNRAMPPKNIKKAYHKSRIFSPASPLIGVGLC